MSKHEKFELEDLPKSAVVNATFYSEESEVDKLINEVVTEHLSKIVEDGESINYLEGQKNIDESSENSNMHTIVEEEFVDVESAKLEAFAKGYEEAKLNYEKQLEELIVDNNFSDLFKEKLQSIAPVVEIDSQIAKVSAEAIAGIAKKLHLILPADFQEIIRHGLFEKLKNFYKEGIITLTIHPDRYDFCREVLQSDEISSRYKDNFQIVQDGKLNKDDCSLEWLDTRLEYNQEQLLAEIDKIIEQLKSTANR
jgi:flagellar biosynthesis/type III secretory pathway protein FliH